MRYECKNAEAVAKRAFYLAWRACGGPSGLGILKNRPQATEGEVWDNITDRGDYPKMPAAVIRVPADVPNRGYADYVFGRVMKLALEWDGGGVSCRDMTPRADYNGWAGTYPSVELLLAAADREVNG